MPGADITFDLPDERAEARFLRRYLVDAWPRLEASDAFEIGWFWRAGPHAAYIDEPHGVAGQSVIIVFEGDPDGVVDQERDRWVALQEEGLVDGWRVRRYEEEGFDSLLEQQRASPKGPVGGEREYRLKPPASRFSLDTLAELDAEFPAVGESTKRNPRPVGFWVVIHYVMEQNGYDWYDEIDACRQAIRNRCRSLAAHRGPEHALDALREAIADLEAMESSLEKGGL